MPSLEKILLIEKGGNEEFASGLAKKFDVTRASSIDEIKDLPRNPPVRVIVFGPGLNADERQILLDELKKLCDEVILELPFIIIAAEDDLKSKLDALQEGCEDYLVVSQPTPEALEEVAARINKTIFMHIANTQLKSQLRMANEAAFTAMTDTGNLGVNLQFMLESFDCDNLDQLGMLLFHSIERYGLRGSLQMRGRYQIKNMEANGMAKDLEAHLLDELKDVGRYYDFGKRSVMNYENVSLLVKNMPIEDERRYGAIKDNIFSLLQGVNARMKAIDDTITMERERELLELLTRRLRNSFTEMDASYQDLMKALAETVDNMSDRIEESILNLCLTETQENALEGIVNEAQQQATELFSRGIRVDEEVKKLIDRIAVIFELKGRPEFYQYLDRMKKLLEQ